MHSPKLQLNALRAFEAAARLLSLTKAAEELHVTPGALSHLIRGLEESLGVKLFDRGVRSISLTSEGRELYPGLNAGFAQIHGAVQSLKDLANSGTLVVSSGPGFTSRWLAPRMHRFATAHPDIDVRISSSFTLANFKSDGVDVALRMLSGDAPDTPDLLIERLFEVRAVAVCSPRLIAETGRLAPWELLGRLTLIHDESWKALPSWATWLETAGIPGIDPERGLRFSSADHALEAVVEGAGILLTLDALAYDDLRTGRLVSPFAPALSTSGAYHVVCLKGRQDRRASGAFRDWVKQEAKAMDWATCATPHLAKPDRH